MVTVTHLLSGLRIGGMERAALRLAGAGMRQGQAHGMVLYDTPFRSVALDFDPGPVPTHLLPRGPGLDLGFALRLARYLRASGSDVVHAHNNTAVFYAALAARLVPGRRPRVVGTFHSWPAHASGRARLLNRLAEPGASLVAVSRELAGRLVGEGWLRRCGVIPNGAMPGHAAPAEARASWRRQLGIPEEAVLVGHVGRMDPIKRHEDLLRASEALRHSHPELVFLLVGQGPLEREIRARAEALPNIRILPGTADIPGLLQGLDLFVLCSAHEGMPLALLEAMTAGLPVIATRVGGIPEMLGEDREPAGILVPPRDPALLAAEIGALARNPARRAALGLAAGRRAASFSFEAECAAYAALYAGGAAPASPPRSGSLA